MLNLVLIGAPATGKDTLANALEKEAEFKILTTGGLYRQEYEQQTAFGIEAHKYWGVGNLCPDEMTNELMSKHINQNNGSLIFNGYPRTLNQAEFLHQATKINIVIELVASEEITVSRLINRGRVDDTEEIIKTRFRAFKDNNAPIVEFYRTKKLYHTISTEQSKEAVLKRAMEILNDKIFHKT